MTYKLVIPCFSGFYYSKWSQMIEDREQEEKDNIIEKYDVDADFIRDSIGASSDWRDECTQKIAEWYAGIYNELIGYELDLEFKVESVQLKSPRYYNYETDKLIMTVSTEQPHDEVLSKLRELIAKHHDELAEIIHDNHSSRDGFWSFMSNDVDEWPNLLDDGGHPYMDYIIAYLIHIEASKETWARHMDKYGFLDYAIYEAIYDTEYLPTPKLEPYCKSDQDEWDEIQEEIDRIETRRAIDRNHPVIPGLFDE